MHEEFVRINPDADTAVLFIHGICGTPDHFRELIPLEALVPEEFSVCNLLLDGHGGSVKDFAATSGEKWREQVFAVYETLASAHERIYVVGHSMGTLFAIQLAAAYPEKVKRLFLLAVPMRPWLKPTMIVDLLAMVFGKTGNSKPQRAALEKAAGIRTTPKLWKYLPWVPRFLDLFKEIRKTERVIGDVKVECRCYQSQKDELVLRSAERVLKTKSHFQIVSLGNSSHFYYSPGEREQLLDDFRNWIKETHD